MTEIKTQPGKNRDDIILEKIAAGLTKEQAIEAVERQATYDATREKKETPGKSAH